MSLRRLILLVLLAAAAAGALPSIARGWEAATTHAGLTEQAAFASGLHERLINDFGLDRGVYQVLEVPPADAPELFALLRAFSPGLGFQPDGLGRQSALAWLVAGSAVADSPARHFGNHFFEPRTRRGLSDDGIGGALLRMRLRISTAVSGADLPRRGIAAPDWLVHGDNPMSVGAFWDQYEKAVSAATPAERSRHLAGALTAAGALLHVLEDMGSPSHVHDDLAAHTELLSALIGDRGSRFEHVAALAFGRLGVPPATPGPGRRRLVEYLIAADHRGLADRTAARFPSGRTLPADRTVERGARRILPGALGLRDALGAIDVVAGAAPGGGVLRDEHGVCILDYAVHDSRLHFSIDDRCALEQAAALLPEIAGDAGAMLDALFRGSLTIQAGGGGLDVLVGATALGKGTLTLLAEDARGRRTSYHRAEVGGGAAGASLGTFPAPPGGTARVAALFSGVDDVGETLRATGLGGR